MQEDNVIRNQETGEVNWSKVPEGVAIQEFEEQLKENPVDKDIDELQKHLGIKLDKEEFLNKSREDILNFVESHNKNNDLTQEEIDEMVDAMLSSVTVPEIIEKKEELDESLGLKPEDLKSLYSYLSGKGEKPLFLDRYLADSENKLRDFQHIMTLLRLATIPQLAALQASIQERLYSPEVLLTMDAKDLSQASANVSREISDILNHANKSIEMMNQAGRVDSRYRAMMDKLLVVPEDVLNQIEHLLNNYE